MTIIQSLILSLVEGLTEFLPISSTAHLVLMSSVLNIVQTNFVKTFEIFIQFGAISAVVLMYYKTLWFKKNWWIKIIFSFMPTAVLGLAFYKIIKNTLLGNIWISISALLLGGIFFIFFEKLFNTKINTINSIDSLSLKNAVLIGLFQSISMIPGISRSGAVIVGAMLVGLNRDKAVEYSFLLAVPTMLAAGSLDLFKSGLGFSHQEISILAIGFIGSFVTAIIAIKFFIKFIQRHTLTSFGIYRIILSILFFLLISAGIL